MTVVFRLQLAVSNPVKNADVWVLTPVYVSFDSVSAIGSSLSVTTNELTLTFDQEPVGLSLCCSSY